MTQPLDKTALVRASWLTELRRQGHRQCIESFEADDGRVCALGLLREIAVERDERHLSDWDDIKAVGALAGLAISRSEDVVCRNDGTQGHPSHTFAEIADVVEGWFK